MKLIGPFKQILTMEGIPNRGPLKDTALSIKQEAGVLVQADKIVAVGSFGRLRQAYPHAEMEQIEGDQVLMPGFIDPHTHLCWAGDRSKDYAFRLSGKSYLDIARAGGGIWSSVVSTRAASEEELSAEMTKRVHRHLMDGVTTIEVKSGYGLSVHQELKLLRTIKAVGEKVAADLVPTCLAAHLKPIDFVGNDSEYLNHLADELFPQLLKEQLTRRIDIFIEDTAFSWQEAGQYLTLAQLKGFDLTVHGDQFTTGGSALAVRLGAVSVDHLEVSGSHEIDRLGRSSTVGVVLPGASLGLGLPFAPARRLLDGGVILAIGSDWNPGSAPMGDLLLQACLLGAYEKLTIAETLAGMTCRAALALKLDDRGALIPGKLADMQSYPLGDYKAIFYHQGKVKPSFVWKNGQQITPLSIT